MISTKVKFIETQAEFKLWQITDFFDPIVLASLLEEIAQYPYKLTLGDRTETDGVRVWCHQQPRSTLKTISKIFASDRIKSLLGHHTGTDFSTLSTRVELCMDSPLSWLRPHTDDPAKKFVLQIYLSEGGKSTRLGSEAVHTRINAGWMFVNNGTELHELPTLLSKRASIIVNYVDDTWNDRSVLVEG